MQTEIKELQNEFAGRGEVKGFQFRQLKKSETAYLYEKTICEGVIYYEVFLRKINRRFKNVQYPKSNSFGIWAWDYRDYEKALRKYNELSS